jgi:hypothetical protein
MIKSHKTKSNNLVVWFVDWVPEHVSPEEMRKCLDFSSCSESTPYLPSLPGYDKQVM